MDGAEGSPPRAARMIGVAGRCVTKEEESYVKQAVFLLRYRMRFLEREDSWAPVDPLPSPDPAPNA